MIIIGIILISVGVIFSTLGALGLVRMPDLYNRLQTSTKATTLGAVCTIVGVGFMNPAWLVKTIIIASFILLTAPISSHNLARGAHRWGIPVTEKTAVDKYKDFLKNQKRDEGEK